MVRVIRSKSSRAYLTKDGGWTPNIGEAWAFENQAKALEHADRLRIEGVELYYSFHAEKYSRNYDFTIPLR